MLRFDWSAGKLSEPSSEDEPEGPSARAGDPAATEEGDWRVAGRVRPSAPTTRSGNMQLVACWARTLLTY